ncbi:MAG: hypothetical protein EXS48_03225 [Candidatus Staskawiczbacteria bacterium]|nr:hypothetical protein [Candidatus Staskawiczbacteria bacterium]
MEGEKTHYEDIIGGTEEEKEEALKDLQAIFDEKSDKVAPYELEKTAEDLEIIEATDIIVNKILRKYGGKPKSLPLDHIYIVKPGDVLKITKGKLDMGIHMPIDLKIVVEKEKSKLLFASTVAHELFHLKSYKSARIWKSGEDTHLYRSGLSMIGQKDKNQESGKGKDYFGMLEEAIVAECTKKFLDETSENDLFKEEQEAIAKFKEWVMAYYRSTGVSEENIKVFDEELKYISNPQKRVQEVMASSEDEKYRQAYAAGMFRRLDEGGKTEGMERYKERKMLYNLMDKIITKSDGKFKDREQIFTEFAKANFSGKYLPLARTIERILGKGSFREIAEEFSNEPRKE